MCVCVCARARVRACLRACLSGSRSCFFFRPETMHLMPVQLRPPKQNKTKNTLSLVNKNVVHGQVEQKDKEMIYFCFIWKIRVLDR